MALYRIGTVARLSGLPIETLRNWERRYRVVVATRTEGRQRLYTRDDLERLRLLKHWVDEGYSAREAHALLHEREQQGIPTAPASGRWVVREQARRTRAASAETHTRAAAARARAAEIVEKLNQRPNLG